MKFYDVAGGSEAWRRLRLGRVTASQMHKVVTPKTMKYSDQADGLMQVLLAEWISGKEVENFKSEWTERGTELEPKAIEAFELLTDQETSNGGFFTDDAGNIGASPDRLVGRTGLLEIKCPLLQNQVGYAIGRGVDTEYKVQIQAQLFVSEREISYVFPFHPLLQIPPIEVEIDHKFVAVLGEHLDTFVSIMLRKRKELEERFGPFVRPLETTSIDRSGDLVSDQDLDLILKAQSDRPEHYKAVGAYLGKIGTVAWAGILKRHGVDSADGITAENWRAIAASMEEFLKESRLSTA